MKNKIKTKKKFNNDMIEMSQPINELLTSEIQLKRAEESLAAEKERLSVTLHSIGDGVIATDTEGNVILMNKVAEELTGQTEKEAVGKPLNKVFYIISEKTRKQCVNPVERVMKEGVVIGLANNTVLISKDGTERFIADSGAPIHDKEGIIIGVILVFRDVTEKRRAEEALKQQKHDLGERVKELSCLYGLDKLSRKEGIAIEEVLKRAVRLIPYSWQYPKITGCHITFENKKYKTKNFKETKWMQRADIIVNNKKAGLLEVCYLEERPESDEGPFSKEERDLINAVTKRLRQIIELRQKKEALESSEGRLRILFEYAPDAYYLNDLKGTFIDGNKAAEKLTGYKRKELIGKSFLKLKLLPPEQIPKAAALLSKNILGKTTGPDEFSLIRKDGIRVSVEIRTFPVKIEGQTMVLGIARDITNRKRVEEQLKESLREKEVLLREIHHRVKNNLQVISSLLNLQSYHIKGKQNKELFKESQNRIKSIALIHEKLYQSKDLARINFKEYTETLVSSLFHSYGYNAGKIVLKIEAEKVFLGIDNAIPCGLIINELVSNSLKHAFPDGKKGEINIALHSSNEKDVELMVSDNGVGIPEDLDFKKTKSLGLHLVTILTEDQLHGQIKLKRKKGTKFQIKFSPVK